MIRDRFGYFRIRARFGLCCLALALLAAGSSAQGQDEPIVREIVFRGLERNRTEDLIPRLPASVKVGRPLVRQETGELLNALNRALASSGCLVLEVLIETEGVEDGVRLVIVVRENPLLYAIEVNGNEKVNDRTISEALPFQIGEPLPFDIVSRIKGIMTMLYRRQGFPEVGVVVEREPAPELPGYQLLRVRISEGARIKIKKLVIRGNEKIPKWRLKALARSRGSFSFIKNYFDEDEFANDLLLLQDFYRARGFFNASVVEGERSYAPNNKWIIPSIEIEEGPQFTVGEVLIEGNRIFARSELTPLFAGLRGRPFRQERFVLALIELRRMYGDNGYIDANITTEETIDYEGATINLILHIAESQRVRVRNITLAREWTEYDLEWSLLDRLMEKISPSIKDEYIYKEVRLQPGEPYRTFQELQTVRNLRRMELFEEVRITPLMTEERHVRDAEIYLKERGARSFVRAGLGYSEEYGVAFEGGFTERNLLGKGQWLDLNLRLGQYINYSSITHLNRYHALRSRLMQQLLGRDEAQLQTSLFYYKISRSAYAETHTGGTFDYGLEQDEFLTDHVRFRLASVDLDRRDEDIRDEDISEDFDASYLVGSVRLSRNWDSTDNDFFPTEGRELNIGLELGAADGFLAKLTGEANGYWRLSEKVVWATILQGGLLPYDADEIGVSERLFLGGDYDMRGFRYRGVGPRDPADDDVAVGGATKALVQNELRYRFNENFYGMLFVDAGTLGEGPLEFDNWRLSAGAAIRVRIPFPRMDFTIGFANPLIRERDDQEYLVHFRIGN